MENFINLLLKHTQHKVLYSRIIYTCIILLIFILGSNITFLSVDIINNDTNILTNVGISAVGGNYSTVNIFSLGLGPWLTALLIVNLMGLRNPDKLIKQTKSRRQLKEKSLTVLLALVQGYYLLNIYVKDIPDRLSIIGLGLLILIAGSMLLIWLADQNTINGIAGPMPIVVISIVRSLLQTMEKSTKTTEVTIWLIFVILLLISIVIIIFVERSEYRIHYIDMMNASKIQKNFLAWKLNPAGSLSIMLSMSVFTTVQYIIGTIIMLLFGKEMKKTQFLELSHPIGITLFIISLVVLTYSLSKLILNPKKKTEDFQRTGNYFLNVKPGKETYSYLNRKAIKISSFSSLIILIVLGMPLALTLLIPELLNEIILSIQFLILVYISLNIIETIRNYLYFDQYKSFMSRYW